MTQKESCCPLSTGAENLLGHPVRIFGELGLRLYTAIKQTKRTNQELPQEVERHGRVFIMIRKEILWNSCMFSAPWVGGETIDIYSVPAWLHE